MLRTNTVDTNDNLELLKLLSDKVTSKTIDIDNVCNNHNWVFR